MTTTVLRKTRRAHTDVGRVKRLSGKRREGERMKGVG